MRVSTTLTCGCSQDVPAKVERPKVRGEWQCGIHGPQRVAVVMTSESIRESQA